jgi:hypothetical protein
VAPPPRPNLAHVLPLVAPAWRGEPLHHWVGMRRIAQRLRREALELPDEVGVHALHALEEGAKAEPAQSGNPPRVETIAVSHALEPVDAIAPVLPDEPEPTYGLLIAAQEMGEDVLHGPAILGAGPQDLARGQPREERQRRAAGRRHAPDGAAPPGRQCLCPRGNHRGLTIDEAARPVNRVRERCASRPAAVHRLDAAIGAGIGCPKPGRHAWR